MSSIKGVRVKTQQAPDGKLYARADNFVVRDGHLLLVTIQNVNVAAFPPSGWRDAEVVIEE